MSLTELDLRRQIRRLGTQFTNRRPEDELINAWRFVFSDEPVGPGDLQAAVTSILKSDSRYFPTAGQVLTKAKEVKAESGGFSSGSRRWIEGYAPCPVCGAELRTLEPDELVLEREGPDGQVTNLLPEAKAPRLGTLHDRKAHERDGRAWPMSYCR